jgi:hypothetical protein
MSTWWLSPITGGLHRCAETRPPVSISGASLNLRLSLGRVAGRIAYRREEQTFGVCHRCVSIRPRRVRRRRRRFSRGNQGDLLGNLPSGSMRSARSGGSGWPTESIRLPRNGLRTLRNRWQRAPTGEGPVVMIIGEPESATHAKGTKPEIWKLAAQGALQSHAAPTRQRDRPRGI